MAERRGPPRCIDVDRHADRLAGVRARHGVNEVELRGVIDHERDARCRGFIAHQARDAGPVGRRVAEHDVVVIVREPERLRERERENAPVTGDAEHCINHRTHAHGF